MSNTIITLLVGLAFIAVSCGQPTNKNSDKESKSVSSPAAVARNEFKPGELYPSVACKNEPSETYSLFLPNVKEGANLPLIVLFDPHGSGNFIVPRYKNLANEFGFVLAASNSSKNGLPFAQSLSIANNLLGDVISRVPVDSSQVYAAGFSGGAKVAILTAKQMPGIHSVIYSGAAADLGESSHSFSLLGFAGMKDMNYADLLQFNKEIKSAGFPHCLIEWSGKHEWPDSATYRKAFYWLAFDAMKRKVMPENKQLIDRYEQEASNKSTNEKSLSRVEVLTEKIAFLDGLINTNDLKQELAKLLNDASIKKQLEDKDKVMNKEQLLHEQYMKNLQYNDLAWWKTEISRMRNYKSGAEGEMYQRELGFISLVCYGACQGIVHSNDDIMAEKLLAIYKLVDPDNADQRYFNAIYLARHKKNTEAIAQLKEAATLGFEDKTKAMNEKAFDLIMNDKGFQEALGMMKQ